MCTQKRQLLEIDNGTLRRQIAYMVNEGQNSDLPSLLWLPGFHASMENVKASAIADWCEASGQSITRFDYTGDGKSEGKWEDGTIGLWLEDAENVLCRLTKGPQLLIGSSMGGWLALLLLRKFLKGRFDERVDIRGVVMIAPAWDMTERLIRAKLPSDALAAVENKGVFYTPSDYGDPPYPITRALLEDGDQHLISHDPFSSDVPIRIFHGLNDTDVPWQGSVELLELLDCSDATLTLVNKGGHRLSAPADIQRLKREIAALSQI